MTTLAHSSELRGRSRGGLAARRPLIRWAWRLFRREWRQQILVIALLTVAVAAAVSSVTIAHKSGPLDYAEFSSANALFELDGADSRKLEASLAAAKERFGTTDVIGHRTLAVPGSVDTVELRSQEPRGPYAGLALRQGSYPEGPDQTAVTDGVATLLGLEIGESVGLDGRRRTVAGIVENPRELSDEFALVSPSSAGAADTVTVLVDADEEAISAFMEQQGDRSALVGSRLRGSYQPAPELAMFSVATVFMLLASLVAAAGFAVIAQRRLRQLGMLAAIGATEKHLRLVLLTNGAVVGAFGTDRNGRGSRTLGHGRADARARARLSSRPAQPALGTLRNDRPRRGSRGERSGLVARASCFPRPRHAGALGATAEAEVRTPLGNRRRGVDRGGHRQPRAVEPRQTAAHRGRDRGDDPRDAAPGPSGNSPLRPGGGARPDRRSFGAARPRPLPSSFRGGTRGHHACPRHRRDCRHHRGGRGEEVSRRTAQPLQPADPRVYRCNGGPRGRRDSNAGPARTNGCSRPPARGESR